MFHKLIVGIMLLMLSLAMPAGAAEKNDAKGGGKATAKPVKCYTLISGRDNEMCWLFEQNLNRFCDEPPMVCERKIHPDFAKYFSFPKWEEVNPAIHLDIIADYIRTRAPERGDCPNPAPVIVPKKGEPPSVTHPLTESDIRANKAAEECQAEWREKKWQEYKLGVLDPMKAEQVKREINEEYFLSQIGLLERMKAGLVKLFRAPIYIFNKQRLVYRLVDFPCSPYSQIYWDSPQVPKLFAVDEKTGKFVPELSATLGDSPKDILIYRGEAQLTVWGGDFPVHGNMTIEYLAWTRCMFKYIGKKGIKKGGKK